MGIWNAPNKAGWVGQPWNSWTSPVGLEGLHWGQSCLGTRTRHRCAIYWGTSAATVTVSMIQLEIPVDDNAVQRLVLFTLEPDVWLFLKYSVYRELLRSVNVLQGKIPHNRGSVANWHLWCPTRAARDQVPGRPTPIYRFFYSNQVIWLLYRSGKCISTGETYLLTHGQPTWNISVSRLWGMYRVRVPRQLI